MEIQGKVVKLRAIELKDLSFLQQMMNSSGIEKMTVNSFFPVSYEKQLEWYHNRDEQKDLRYMIQLINGETIGMVMVKNINWRNASAEMGIKIGNVKERVKNDVYEAVMLTLEYCFNELNLHVVTSDLLTYNHLSKKLNLKCGFVEEGILRERVYKRGQYHDLVVLSIMRDEFVKAFQKYKDIVG